MNCYGKDPYNIKMEKQSLIKKGRYLLNSKCCDEDCEVLKKDIEKTINKCHSLFRDMHLDDLDLEGKIQTDSLCSQLEEKKADLQQEMGHLSGVIGSKLKGGIRRKSIRRKSRKSRRRKSRKSRSN